MDIAARTLKKRLKLRCLYDFGPADGTSHHRSPGFGYSVGYALSLCGIGRDLQPAQRRVEPGRRWTDAYGAFAAFYVVYQTENLWLGVLAAVIVGAIMGLAMAFVSVNLGAEQGISGIGFYLFGLGMSDLLFSNC